MNSKQSILRTGEKEARQILLARAIEIVDTQGRLIGDAERDTLDVRAGEVARAARGKRLDVGSALRSRAAALLEVVARRNPGIAGLQEIPPWRSALIVGLPLLALVLGFSSDIVANPHRLDLVSLPLLAVVLWNVVFYLLLLVRVVASPNPLDSRLRRLASMFSGVRGFSRYTRAEVTANFVATWQKAALQLNGARATLALHLAAAAWAAGAALSLFVRGFAYEYKVGWESTWLSAEGVQSLLAVLFWPATALLKLTPFTLQEIQAMRFDASAVGSLAAAQRWVFLYAGTLAIVVIVPRLALALLTWAHERTLAARVPIDLDEPYFQQLIDRLVPSQVRLAVIAHRDADRAALDRVLRKEPEPGGTDGALISTPIGDALLVAAEPTPPPLPVEASSQSTWLERLTGWRLAPEPDTLDEHAAAGEIVLHVIGDAADLESTVARGDPERPGVLLLVNPPSAAAEPALLDQCHLHQKHHASVADVLAFDSFARCWVQEPRLLEAIAACAPPSQMQGARRLAVAWDRRNAARFRRAMSILADGLLRAAGETEEIKRPPFSFRDLVSKEQRDARDTAKREAMAVIVDRLKHDEAATMRRLLELHRIADTPASIIEQGLEVKVDMKGAVDATQAGLAGAASGAAVGASVDLVTGGLTLGVAAMLGALVGGGAALASAAWNNRKSPNGATTIFLSDEMLLALVEANLLRYLAVIHAQGTAPAEMDSQRASWNSEVVAAVEAHRAKLVPLWSAARDARDATDTARQLTDTLETIAVRVLRDLYPAAKIGAG